MSVSVTVALCLFMYAIVYVQSEGTCPRYWAYSEESDTCIRLFTDTQDWNDARDICKGEGGDLIKIVNEEMDHFIADSYGRRYEFAWIGLNDFETEDVFVWLDEDTEPLYTNWRTEDEPDLGENQHCGYMSVEDDFWGNEDCDIFFSNVDYLCEIDSFRTTIETTTQLPTTSTTAELTSSTYDSTNVMTTTGEQHSSVANADGSLIVLATPADSELDNEDTSSIGGLGGEAIAGIAIGCLVLLLLPVAYVGYRMYKLRQNGGRKMDSVKFVNDSEGSLSMKA